MPRQTIQNFSEWDIEKLSKYSNDLESSSDWRDKRIKRRIDSIITNYSIEDQDMYKLTPESKKILKWFSRNSKTISWTSDYWFTLVTMWENRSIYVIISNDNNKRFRFHIDKNMSIKIDTLLEGHWSERWRIHPKPDFTLNKVLSSFTETEKTNLKNKKRPKSWK